MPSTSGKFAMASIREARGHDSMAASRMSGSGRDVGFLSSQTQNCRLLHTASMTISRMSARTKNRTRHSSLPLGVALLPRFLPLQPINTTSVRPQLALATPGGLTRGMGSKNGSKTVIGFRLVECLQPGVFTTLCNVTARSCDTLAALSSAD